jgi:type IV pilus assembly protein PilA
LIELMIVVVLVGILAVLAVIGVRAYMAHAKTAEARNSLGRIAKDAATTYEKDSSKGAVLARGASGAISRSLCASASASVPSSAALIPGRKYQSSPKDWDVDRPTNAGFACLKYTMDTPQYYMYSYAAKGGSNPGDTFTATAQGDLNGDGVLSLFQITGALDAKRVLNVAPAMTEVRPED